MSSVSTHIFWIMFKCFLVCSTVFFIREVHCDETGLYSEPNLIPEGYDRTETGIHGVALNLSLDVWIESIVRIDIAAMEFTTRCYIIHRWTDIRLKRENHHVVIRNDPSELWLPDTYCLNCRKSTIGENARQLIRIDVDGSMYLSQLSQLYVSCMMNLASFPFDVQECKLQFGSYSLNDSYVNLFWYSKLTIPEMKLDQFIVSNKSEFSTRQVIYPQGNFTVLEAKVFFARQMGFYIMQFMVPSVCLVFLSWITLFMSPEDVGNRVAIGITLILTMIFMIGYVNNNLPKVAYVKAIDLFLLVSLITIILSVLESALLYWIQNHIVKSTIKKKLECGEFEGESQPKVNKETSSSVSKPEESIQILSREKDSHVENGVHKRKIGKASLQYESGKILKDKSLLKKFLSTSNNNLTKKLNRLDHVSRILLPCLYILYTILYMHQHMNSKDRREFE